MTTVNVQFADSTGAAIVSYFGCPQDAALWPNQGAVSTSDARWRTYFQSQSPLVQGYLPAPQ